MTLDELNDHYAIKDDLRFTEDAHGLLKASITNIHATAEIYLFGAHITSFRPQEQHELLWMSPEAIFAPPKAIRGGVPICWPWFGKDPEHPQRAQHGFARNRYWDVIKSASTESGETQLVLRLRDDHETMALWPHSFQLEMRVTVGKQLLMELITTNTDSSAYTIGAALHTYFQVDDITTVEVSGLEGVTYIDTTDAYTKDLSDRPVTFEQETDRIYLDTSDTCIITDHTTRQIEIAKGGSMTTVVWNPWTEKAKAMQDFSDDGYSQMLCIESVNTLEDSVHLDPGQSHTLMQSFSISI